MLWGWQDFSLFVCNNNILCEKSCVMQLYCGAGLDYWTLVLIEFYSVWLWKQPLHCEVGRTWLLNFTSHCPINVRPPAQCPGVSALTLIQVHQLPLDWCTRMMTRITIGFGWQWSPLLPSKKLVQSAIRLIQWFINKCILKFLFSCLLKPFSWWPSKIFSYPQPPHVYSKSK